jgi:hypothetical protein
VSELPQGLLQQLGAHPVSGEHLEVLGKHASELWHSGRVATLTEGVVETVKHAGLSPEQVKRVVEFSNTHAYLTEFKKEGAPHKVIDFGTGGPANYSEILKDLNDGGGGSVFDRGVLDFKHPPGEVKVASERAETELVELFGTSSALPYEEPFADALDIRDKLAAANEHLLAEMSGLEVMYADLADRLYRQTKQAALSGTSLSDLIEAWGSVSTNDDYVKVAFQLFGPRLLREGVFGTGAEMMASVEKTASVGVVNKNHPLVVDFQEYSEVLGKLAEARAAREEVRESLAQVTVFLKHASGGVVHKVVGAARAASKPVGKAVGATVGALAGDRAGGVAETIATKGVQYAPHAAALAGANEVRRHMLYGPVGSQVTGQVLKHVPMTPQYNQHNYEIATGQ